MIHIDKINTLLQLENYIYTVYEKLYRTERDTPKNTSEMQKIFAQLKDAIALEKDFIHKLPLTKENTLSLLQKLNTDNHLEHLFCAEDAEVDFCQPYDTFSYVIKTFVEKKKSPITDSSITLEKIHATSDNHPFLKRLSNLILSTYYHQIENPPLQYDAWIPFYQNEFQTNSISKWDNVLATVREDIHVTLDSMLLCFLKIEEIYYAGETYRSLLLKTKYMLCYSQPSLENYALQEEFYTKYQHPLPFCRFIYPENKQEIYQNMIVYELQEQIYNILEDISQFRKKSDIENNQTLQIHLFYLKTTIHIMQSRQLYFEENLKDVIESYFVNSSQHAIKQMVLEMAEPIIGDKYVDKNKLKSKKELQENRYIGK